MAQNSQQVYQLKVTLNGIEPQIWRRVLVKSSDTFDDLHTILQICMGWQDRHIYAFQLGDILIVADQENGFFGRTILSTETCLEELFSRETICTYRYDFGDNWEHTLELEAVLYQEPGKSYPICMEGARSCPPEDCGGTEGYDHLLKVLAQPSHPEHSDIKCWLFDVEDARLEDLVYDPEAFDLDETNKGLKLWADFLQQGEEVLPTREQWEKLFAVADKIKKAQPWQTLTDCDYIAVKPLGWQEPVYYVTMGIGNECMAIAAFRGNKALAGVERIRMRSMQGAPFAALGHQECAICYFGDREELETGDRKIIKELGLKFRGRGQWVYFRSLRCGYAPWTLSAMDAALLCETMEEYLTAYTALEQGEVAVDFFKGDALLRVQSDSWENKSLSLEQTLCQQEKVIITDELQIARLQRANKSEMNIELDVFYLPTPVQETKKMRPYYPQLILIIDPNSETICKQQIIANGRSASPVVIHQLEEFVGQWGLPNSVHVRDDQLANIVEDWCAKLGVKLIINGKMPTMNDAILSLMEYMGVLE